MKAISLLLILGVAAVSSAQFTLSSVTGSFVDSGASAYPVGGNVDGYGLLAASGASASFSLKNRPNGNDYGAYARSVVAFKAQNFNPGGGGDTLDVRLPSDRIGGSSSAADGSFQSFGLTSTTYAGTTNNFTFNGSITADGSASAEILMESVSLGSVSPRTVTLDSGTFSATNLDNGAWDQDPTVGHVLINKELTPNISLNYTIPNYVVQREMISLVGESLSNPFYDRYYSDMIYFLTNPGGTAVAGDNRSALNHEFAPGDMTSAVLVGGSGSITLDVSTLSVGTYEWFGGDVVWDWMGDTSGFPNTYPYPATGGWNNYQTLSVDVVPEPCSMIAMVAGIGGLLAKRRKKIV